MIADEASNGSPATKLDAFYALVDDEPEIVRQYEEVPVVQLDVLRAISETLDQVFVKEYESTWINDLKRYETLGASKKKQRKKDKE